MPENLHPKKKRRPLYCSVDPYLLEDFSTSSFLKSNCDRIFITASENQETPTFESYAQFDSFVINFK